MRGDSAERVISALSYIDEAFVQEALEAESIRENAISRKRRGIFVKLFAALAALAVGISVAIGIMQSSAPLPPPKDPGPAVSAPYDDPDAPHSTEMPMPPSSPAESSSAQADTSDTEPQTEAERSARQ